MPRTKDPAPAVAPTSDRGEPAAIAGRIDPAAVAGRMVDIFRGEIPGYQRLPASVVEGQILEVARRNVELFVVCVGTGVKPSEAQLEPFRASARDRAAEGMPLEDLLHAYRLGGRLAWEAMVAAAGPTEQQALPSLAGLVMEYLDGVSSAVANSYLEERQHLVSEEERRLRTLLDALVGALPLDAGLQDLMERLRFPAAEAYRPFAAMLPDSTARAHSQLAGRLRDRGLLAVTEGMRVTGLAVPERGAALLDAPDPRAVLVEGEVTPRNQLAAALEEVRLAADVAQRLGRTGLLDLPAMAPELLLARSPRLATLIRNRALEPLRPVPGRRGPDLVKTLRVLFEERLDRRRTAAALHVHPNTLDYRLRRVQELTGLDLDKPGDIALLVLALSAQSLEPVRTRRAGDRVAEVGEG
jgi:hypothetical protein